MGEGEVRSTPVVFRSKTHASTTVMGKPIPRAITTAESTHSGHCSPCMTGSTICRVAKAAMP